MSARHAMSLIGLALGLGIQARGEDPVALEAGADREHDRAVSSFRASYEAWERARPRGQDPLAEDRSRRERGVLALYLRDTSLLEVLRRTSRKGLSVGEGLEASALRGEAPPLPVDALERLVKIVQTSARRVARLPGSGERDALLLAEVEAWTSRIQGEELERGAASLYRRALAALSAERETPALALARARLAWKLRDYPLARRLVDAAGTGSPPLARDAEIKRLQLLRELALVADDQPLVARAGEDLRKLGGTAGQNSLPAARFPGLLAGSSADLSDAAGTLHLILGSPAIPARPRALFALLLSDCALELGDVALAEEVLRGASGAGDPWLEGALSSRLGHLRVLLGDHEAALEALERARASVAGLSGSESFLARLGLNLARAQLGLGEASRARDETAQVLRSKDLSLDLRIRARILAGSALFELAREKPELWGDVETAFQSTLRELGEIRGQEKALESAVELEATILINLGNVAREQALCAGGGPAGTEAARRRKDAAALAEKALRLAQEARLWPLAAAAAGNLGELYLEAGDLAAARGLVDWSLARARELHLFEGEWRALWYRARLADLEGRSAEADSDYAQAGRVIESYRSRVLDAERKSGFLTDKMEFYRDCVRREAARGRADLALAAAERAKARALVDSLGWRFVALADPRQTSLYREYVSLLARSERARAGGRAVFWGSEARLESFDDLRARLVALRDRLVSDVTHGAVLRALIDGDPARVEEILRDLSHGTTLVEYFALRDHYVAILAQEGQLELVHLQAAPAEVEALCSRFVRGNAADAALARRLGALLVDPLAGRIRGDRVTIVPFGPLHQVPFETLRDDRGFLLARWSISYLPSASALRHLRRGERPGKDARLLAIVDPDTDYNRDGKPDLPRLEFARKEVEGVAASFPARVVLEGRSALKAACQREAPAFDVIHYACHGEFYPGRPWESTLFLAAGVNEGVADDGRLRASEVYALDLRKSFLVALSGCETGRSTVSPGDDAVSIGTAFLHSGAPSLLVSLWKVEDQATADLMQAFYDKWIREGKDRSRALRDSKLELLARGYAQPRQWGAFVLLGDS